MAFRLCFALPQLEFDPSRRTVNACAVAAAMVVGGLALRAEGGATTTVTSSEHIQAFATPPQPPPLILRDVSRADAIAINQRIPFSVDENVPARPFRFRGDAEARGRALECLALAIYYEAGNQDQDGQEAVAQVVLNRVRHPAFPGSICDVVFQRDAHRSGCQFTFTCDGSLLRDPEPGIWSQARQVAEAALDGAVFKPVGLATHYHADYVVPYWATRLEKNAQVGVHIFYRWPDAWGMPAAFARTYAGKEDDPVALRAAALMDDAAWAKDGISPDQGLQLAVDPRMELLAVVQLLANGSSDLAPADQRYERDVQTYFAQESGHEAVQLFKKLSKDNANFAATAAQHLLSYSPPPELEPTDAAPAGSDGAAGSDKNLAQFVEALRGFARSTDFERFFVGHKPFYTSVIRRTQQQVGMARAYWEAYTKSSLGSRKAVLSSLVSDDVLTACQPRSDSVTAILSLGSLAKATDADLLLRTEGPQGPLAAAGLDSRASDNPVLDEQIVQAVFARVAVLTQDRKRDPRADKKVSKENPAASMLDRQLLEYVTHRAQFATFGSFAAHVLPDLRAAAKGVSATSAQCDTASISEAEPRRLASSASTQSL